MDGWLMKLLVKNISFKLRRCQLESMVLGKSTVKPQARMPRK